MPKRNVGAAPGGGGPAGVVEYASWAELPVGAADGAEALVGGTLYTYRAAISLWLPWYMPGTTRDARSWGDEGDLTAVTAGGWTINDPVAVTKTAGQPLNITGAGVAIAMSCTPPSVSFTAVFRDITATGTGTGSAGKLWVYWARTLFVEFLMPNATEAQAQLRNPNNGALMPRPVVTGAAQLFAVSWVISGNSKRVILWSPDDTAAQGDAGVVSWEFASGSVVMRFYKSISGTANTSFNLDIIT